MDVRAGSRVTCAAPPLAMLALLLAAPAASADCTPAGTPHDDTIECTDTDTQGVRALRGDDIISILPAADVVLQSMGIDPTPIVIDAGFGDDTVTNDGTINVESTSSQSDTAISLSLAGGDDVDASTSVETASTGIAGGHGKDHITNNGALTAGAAASVDNVSVEANLIDLSHADTSTTVRSTAIGIDGGDLGDGIEIGASGTVDANAGSTSHNVSVEANLVDAAVSDSGLAVESTATGVQAGTGHDAVHNAGQVAASASSEVRDVGVNVSFVDATVAEGRGSDVSTTLDADATGIDTGKGKDGVEQTDTGSVTASATSDANSLGVSLASEGVPGSTVTLFREGGLAAMGLAAGSNATGVDTGDDADAVCVAGDVTAGATATARQQSINVGVAVLDFHVPTPGIVLGSAGTSAAAGAAGIATGDGDDTIASDAHLDVDANATAAATTVSVNIAELSFDLAPDFPSLPSLGASLVVADTATRATATASGIDGGTGNDTIGNTGILESDATATGGSTSASASLDVEYKEGESMFAIDAVGARSSTNADATAVGIDGGDGRDTIDNAGRVHAGAMADGNTVSVGVAVSGSLQGNGGGLNLAATDSSTTGTARATGIQGGDDRDSITNSGTAEAVSNADVDGVDVGVTAAVAAKGLVAGASLARAVSLADATSVGIDGGAAGDAIDNTDAGTVTSNATANAGAVAVTVNVDGTTRGVAGGGALTDAGTTANATATGIRNGDATGGGTSAKHDRHDHDPYRNDDTLVNDGTVNVDAQAHTHSVGVSADVALAEKGVAVGVTLADTSARATAVARGLEGDDADNVIANGGQVNVGADAGSTAVSVSLSAAGTTAGVGAGVALTDSGVTVSSMATGIDAAAGDDYVTNAGSIALDGTGASATAVSAAGAGFFAESGVAIGAALGRTSASADTRATGIAGGSGDDALASSGTITMDDLDAHADAIGVTLGVAIAQNGLGVGGALVDGSSTATLSGTGLDGGSGDDWIFNGGTLSLSHGEADADAVSVSVNVTGVENGVALGGALLDADATATATATGMSGGTGDDALVNHGAIDLEDFKANSDAVGVGASLTVAGNGVALGGAFALTGAHANARATGMDGGAGEDFIRGGEDAGINLDGVHSEADAVSVSVGLSGGDAGLFIGAGVADATGTADTRAAGIDAGADGDRVFNSGRVAVGNVDATAHAAGISVGAAGANAGVAAGVSIASTSGNAGAHATGIDGAGGDDLVCNSGNIDLATVHSRALAVGVDVSLGVTLAGGVAGGISLGNAGATATADARGIAGGTGADRMFNDGAMTLDDIVADATATGVSVELGVTNAGVAIGGALVDTRADATVTAKGIDGGTEDDVLVNGNDMLLRNVHSDAGATSVGVTVNGAIEGGVAGGVALTDSSSHATTNAIGLDGGDGDDWIHNEGTVRVEDVGAHARATGVSVSAQASFAGIAAGAAIADTSGSANTVVKGLDGGRGDDILWNDGTVNVAGDSMANALSLGINVGGTIGIAGGAEITSADMTADTVATGLDGGRGRDVLATSGDVTATAGANAVSRAISVGVSVGVGGDASLADATTTAGAHAAGIDGGNSADGKHHGDWRYGERDRDRRGQRRDGRRGYGNEHQRDREHDDRGDWILNTGSLTAIGTASASGTSVGGNLFGFALGDLANEANADATGIRTTGANDEVRSEGTIAADAKATASGLTVGVSLGGKAMGDATTTADATAAGIATGRGSDEIANTGGITVDARGTASTNGVSVGLAGVSEVDATVTALATAAGIDGGDDGDRIRNTGTITATAGEPTADAGAVNCPADAPGTCARVSGVSVNLAGAGFLDAATEARSTAFGIAGGRGRDVIDSDGLVTAMARAKTVAGGVNVNIAGAALSDAHTLAHAGATGIDGGDDDDIIRAAGSIGAGSSSHVLVSNFGFSLAGAANFDATLNADALGTGIDGGAGHDVILNDAALDAHATATASSGGNSTVVFGASGSGARSGALADAAGIRGGVDGDVVGNRGTIEAHATGSLSLSNSSFTFGGAGGADGRLTATTLSAGITGDDGHDLVASDGLLTVDANSTLTASSGSTIVFGAGTGGAGSGAVTHAVGIDGGARGDALLNRGTLIAGSHATLTLSGSSFTFGGAGGARGSLSADTSTVGIAGGSGADVIRNSGNATATATSSLTMSGGSSVAFGSGSTGADAGAITDVRGIAGGDDGDFLFNRGAITATSSATLALTGGSFTFGGTGGTGGTLTATTRTAAIDGGDGRDFIHNEGELHVTNASGLSSSGSSDVAFGSSGAHSTAGSVADAAGIDGGNDDDAVWNTGRIFVDSTANLSLGSSSYTFGGTGDVGGRLNATTDAVGIRAGAGNDFVDNDADLAASARSTLSSSGTVNATFGTSASGAVVATNIGTTGIDGGAGNDAIRNHARVDVDSTATISSSSSSYVFGGSTSGDDVANASSSATGLAGRAGRDFLFNDGDIRASAGAFISGSGSAHAEFGGSRSSGEIVSGLATRGMDGGADDDWAINKGTITAVGTSSASMSHNTDTGFLFGGGDSRAKAGTSLVAYGVDLGDGDNGAWNDGAVSIDLYGTASASSNSDGADIFDGDAFSRSDATVSATAIGVRTGAGDDGIDNAGSIDIRTWRHFEIPSPFPGIPPLEFDAALGASASANADGDGIDGDGTIRSYGTTGLLVAGIDAGDGTNDVTNTGTITLDARARASASGTVDSDAGGTSSAVRRARVTAHAYGIRTGSGDDQVVNDGTISVSTRADNNSGSGDITATATGIDTGSGNDTVINDGTITATRIVNGSASAGVAIAAGAGDDHVELLDGSVTNGDIDLGSGNDMLSLSGTPTVNGGFRNASSALTLEFNDFGSFAGGLPGATAIKNGPGTFRLSLLNPMDRIEVRDGTLELQNDYDFTPHGLFQATVHGGGRNGRFRVDGEAGLDGTLQVVRGSGAYRDRSSFEVFESTNGIRAGTTFSRIDLPKATRLLSFDAEQSDGGVDVTAHVKPFSTVAHGTNQRSVASTLDRTLPNVSGDLGNVMGAVQTLRDSQFDTAFASLSPETYAMHSQAALGSATRYTGLLRDRMSALHDDRLAQAGGESAPVRLAYNGNLVPGLLDQGDGASHVTGLWLRAFGQEGEHDATGGMEGFDFDVSGITIGLDRRFADRYTLGVSLAAARSNVDVRHDVSHGDIDSRFLSLYGSYFHDRFYVNGTLSLGHNDYDTHRNMVVGATTTPLTSSHKGDITAATIGLGRYYAMGHWWAEPFGHLQYTSLDEDGFTEHGSGAGLNVQGRTTESLVSTVGARLSRMIDNGNGGSWTPEASLALLHDFAIDNQVINASYVDAPDATFSIRDESADRNGAALGLGIGYRTQDGFSSTLKYNGEFRDHREVHGISGEVRWEF